MSRSPGTVAHNKVEFAATEFVEARKLEFTRTRDMNHRPQPPRKKSASNKRTRPSREAGGICDCDMDESCMSLVPERRATSRCFLGARIFTKEGFQERTAKTDHQEIQGRGEQRPETRIV